ncbi:MAG: GNAT family N-acetyltransferase [Lysobacterales bacterium]
MTTFPVIIRRAVVADVEQLALLFDAYRQFYSQPADFDRARGFVKERLARGESVVFLAESNTGSIVGFTQLYPVFSSVSAARTFLLNDLFVATEARRQGVAARLLDAAVEFARGSRALRLTLSTAITNTTAQALYEREGWHRESGYVEYSLQLL